jgi:hypothetical protein
MKVRMDNGKGREVKRGKMKKQLARSDTFYLFTGL